MCKNMMDTEDCIQRNKCGKCLPFNGTRKPRDGAQTGKTFWCECHDTFEQPKQQSGLLTKYLLCNGAAVVQINQNYPQTRLLPLAILAI